MKTTKTIIMVITVISIISAGSIVFADNGYRNHMGNNDSMRYGNHMGNQNGYHNNYHNNTRNNKNSISNEKISEQKRARKFGTRIYRGQTNLKNKNSKETYNKRSDK